METGSSLASSQAHTSGPYPEPVHIFRPISLRLIPIYLTIYA